MSESDDELDQLGVAIDQEIKRRAPTVVIQKVTLHDLSMELILHIFTYGTAHDLFVLCCVGKAFRRATLRNALWEALYKDRWPNQHQRFHQHVDLSQSPPVPVTKRTHMHCSSACNWRHQYVHQLRLEHAWLSPKKHRCVYLPAEVGGVLQCEFLGCSDRAISCGADCNITVWDIQHMHKAGCLKGHEEAVLTSSYDSHSNLLVTGSEDSTLRIWDIAALSPIITIPTANTIPLRITQHNSVLFAATLGGAIALYDLRAATCTAVLQGSLGAMNSLQVAAPYLYAAGADNTLRSWDIRCNKRFHEVPDAHWGGIYSMGLSPGGVLVTAAGDRLVKLWTVHGGHMTPLSTCHGHREAVWALQVDETKAVSGSLDQHVRVWDLATGRLLNSLDDHLEPVCCLDFCNDRMLTGGFTALTLWTFGDV